MNKNFLKKFFITTICLLLITGSFVYVVDPFFHYHYPYFGMKPIVYDELNQNPGIAEHFDYDSIILGSSMTQNFTASKFEQVFPEGGKTVKLTYSAIRTGNMNWMLKKAFDTRTVKNVYLGLDLDPFIDQFGSYYFDIPEHLYDKNPFNDVNYLFNKEVVLKAWSMILSNKEGQIPDLDDSYKWNSEFSTELALQSVDWDLLKWEKPHFEKEYVENTKKNFQVNVEPHIAEHPETTFYIFFPPYSILWWNMKASDGTLDTFLASEEYLLSELVKYENVKIFGLQTIEEIVTDLDNYKDYNHYSPEINDWIMNTLSGEDYVLTQDNYKDYVNHLREFVINYDYSEYDRMKKLQ